MNVELVAPGKLKEANALIKKVSVPLAPTHKKLCRTITI